VTPFRDRNVVGQGNQANKRRYRKSPISSEREGLRTSNFVYEWSTITRITDVHGDLQTESSGLGGCSSHHLQKALALVAAAQRVY